MKAGTASRFDQLHIPYDYIADQKLKTMTDLRSKYDVILFGPVGGSAQSIINGRPMMPATRFRSRGRPLRRIWPERPTPLTICGRAWASKASSNLHKFVEEGGLFITITGNATIPIDYGFVEGVSVSGFKHAACARQRAERGVRG